MIARHPFENHFIQAVIRYLKQRQPEVLAEFEAIVRTVSVDH